LKMYGIVQCFSCSRPRIIELKGKTSECPYCGNKDPVKDMKVHFRSDDQAEIRAAFNRFTGFEGSIEKKRARSDTDPYSSLVYRYEHCSSLDEKMEVLSKGLTELYGTFTLEDVEKLEPKNAEKMLKAMLDGCIVYETKYGHYKA